MFIKKMKNYPPRRYIFRTIYNFYNAISNLTSGASSANVFISAFGNTRSLVLEVQFLQYKRLLFCPMEFNMG